MPLVILTGVLKTLDTAEYKGCCEMAKLELFSAFLYIHLLILCVFQIRKM